MFVLTIGLTIYLFQRLSGVYVIFCFVCFFVHVVSVDKKKKNHLERIFMNILMNHDFALMFAHRL